MKAIELSKSFDPASFEDRIYGEWKEKGCFQPQSANGKKPFVVVIPPPNVTGILHMGHGLNISLQDVIVRFHRMLGEPTLWLPGTDHAGIATQNVVERRLKDKGSSREKIGRESFVKEAWKVSDEHHDIIVKQIEKIGSSCDWTRERFTLDDGLSKAVREVFVQLYERGLIYRGKYLVNWCSSCGTAISDDEVEHKDESGFLYHIRYGLETATGEADSSRWVEIATTRPETMLGDVAVAYHPDDERFKLLAGCKAILPIAGRSIPIIADDFVDREFGTGLVKITPAHDPADFEVGQRHHLTSVNILDAQGRLNNLVPENYRGLDVLSARKKIVEELEALGLLVAQKPIVHSIGRCYRCDTLIEPFLSEQWFVKMQPLARKALDAWKRGEIRFYPQRWERTYEHWLENIKDWCISRQLWWGHRLPVWFCAHCKKFVVAREEPTVCPFCGSVELSQIEDVLDTWFSSWLWPFSTLGWPKSTADLAKFYPTTALITGYDIIFFWVARMIMAGLEFMDKAPFRDVYLTTLVRDKQGRKMSKSLANGIDPLDIVERYGADALKFTLAFMTSQGQDVLIDEESFKLGSRFANKVWNASRYIFLNLEGRTILANPAKNDFDNWIEQKLSVAASSIRESFAEYRFNDAAKTAYEYFWNDFCDWYVEVTKLSFKEAEAREADRAISVLIHVLEESLKLLHPLLPFVTEELWSKLAEVRGSNSMLVVQSYPEGGSIDAALDSRIGSLSDLIHQVRNVRAEIQAPASAKLALSILTLGNDPKRDRLMSESGRLFEALAGIGSIKRSKPLDTRGTITIVGKGFEAWLHIEGSIDTAKLIEQFQKMVSSDENYAQKLKAKLGQEGFVNSAPPDVIAKEKEKLVQVEGKIERFRQYIKEFSFSGSDPESVETSMDVDAMLKLRAMHLAPYIKLATILIGRSRHSGGNMFRHQIDTFGILMDYGYIDSVLLKASIIHDVLEDAPEIDRNSILEIDEESVEVYNLVMEVTRRPIETKPEFLSRIRDFGSDKAKILKAADRISNMIQLGYVTNISVISRYADETEAYVYPIAARVDQRMLAELQELVQTRRQFLARMVEI